MKWILDGCFVGRLAQILWGQQMPEGRIVLIPLKWFCVVLVSVVPEIETAILISHWAMRWLLGNALDVVWR